MKRTPLKRRMPLRARKPLSPKRDTGDTKKKRKPIPLARIRRRKADIAWSKMVRERAKWRCEWCGSKSKQYGPKSTGLHAAHIFSRGIPATRHDEANGVALCFYHHLKAHNAPLDFADFVRRHLGEAEYEALRARAKGAGQMLDDIIARAVRRHGP